MAALPTFNQADLKALQAVITDLLAAKAARVAPKPNDPLQWLYGALQAVLNVQQPYALFITTRQGKQFAKHGPQAIAFIEAGFGKLGNKTKGLALMRYLLGLLIASMKQRKIPVTLNTVTLNLGQLGQVFEDAYPGYAQNGLTSLIWNKIESKE